MGHNDKFNDIISGIMQNRQSSIRILSLESLPEGYSGFFEEIENYVDFTLPSSGKIKLNYKYKKADFGDYEHFAAVMGKFDPYVMFLKNPINVDSVTVEELDRVYRELKMEGFINIEENDMAIIISKKGANATSRK